MTIDYSAGIPEQEASRDFARIIRTADEKGQVVILKNNRPRYVLLNLEENPLLEMSDDEKIDFVAARILKKYKAAFLELAR